jgi:hypothetical protein
MNRAWLRLRRATWIPPVVLLTALCWSPAAARAETVYLSSGEVIDGKIVRMDDTTISIESDKGYGVIQINKSDIILIEYDNKKRDPSRTIGIGYYHRSAPVVASAATTDYGLDAFSMKYWLSSTDSIDALLGYYNASYNNQTQLSIFSLDIRYAAVFSRKGMLDLYWGGSFGLLNVNDKVSGNNVNDTGTRAGIFLGAEILPVSLPNLGISSEVGFFTQTIGKRTVNDLSATTFPTFSVRYYF